MTTQPQEPVVQAAQPTTTPKRRIWPWLIGCVGLIVLCVGCLAAFGFALWNPFGWLRSDAPTTEGSAPVVSVAACTGWNTAPGVTQELQPGQTARGDVEVDGQPYFDAGGKGEGTSVINLSSNTIEIYSRWGSGCETSTDLKFLVNKDLKDGCGSVCDKVRIVTVTDNGVTEQFYTAPLP